MKRGRQQSLLHFNDSSALSIIEQKIADNELFPVMFDSLLQHVEIALPPQFAAFLERGSADTDY